ncbi:restriction endonuclease [Ereboglobus luteus]|uniref:restriction endonuclease n=1 Tax=Ereboglobus luteus TaxID=1796921 RepID=UPI0013753616|nr:restriction endonuclease [Ereboglobus luteus]
MEVTVGKLNPDIVAQWVEQDCQQTDYLPVRDVLAISLRNRIPNLSEEQASEYSEELTQEVCKSLESRIYQYAQDGIIAPFKIDSDEGANYIKSSSTVESDLLLELRKRSSEIFELFCKVILSKLYAEAFVVGGSHDGGVDFYAIGLPWDNLTNPMPPSSKALVIGQSKRYKKNNTVGECEIREFIGGAINQADELRRKHPDRVGLLTPLLLAFWTTGDFSVSAKKYARKLGLWYLNGIGLAQLATRLGLQVADLDNLYNQQNTSGLAF